MKSMKHLAWVPSGQTTCGHMRMKAPVNSDEWLPCYHIFANALEMLGYCRGQPLTAGQEHIRRLSAELPYLWGVVCVADCNMRSEHWGEL